MNCNRRQRLVRAGLLALAVLPSVSVFAQYRQEPGHSIGTVKKQGNLIVLTLDEDVLGKANLFNLAHRTLRFTPEGSRYRVEVLPPQWVSEFGPELPKSDASIKNFAFPFSGKS